jgi:ribosomal protein S18 acetylase RimI-like enzyme
MIVKAIHEHASVGMDDAAIVTCRDGRDLAECLRAAESRLGKPCFAEQFIDGREFNLSVLAGPDGPQVLPPAEIDFTAFPPAKPRIVGYSAKWHADTFEFLNTPRRFDFPPSDAGLLARLTEVAVRCWSLFDLRGYVRVDFRVDRAGCPFVLEVNTNPCISPDAGFAAALERAGITYAAAVQRIVEDAVRQPRSLDAEVAGPGCDSTPAAMSKTQPAFRYEVTPADRESVRRIVESTGFFQPAEIDVAIELVDEHLAKGLASGYYFIFAELNGQTIGYACYGPIACAVGSYDLFWIAVDKPQQRCGWGQTLIAEAERRVREAGGRRVYVETSNRPQYAATRTFYERVGYRQEAVLPEFYGVGDDKVIYVKVI